MDKLVSSRQRVLVVEDEWLTAAVITDNLQSAGYEVAGPVGTVREAVGLLATETVDDALLDIHLHGQTGFPIADVLARRVVPFAFSSGSSRHQIPDTHKDRNLLPKPLDTRLLLDEIASMTADAVPGQ